MLTRKPNIMNHLKMISNEDSINYRTNMFVFISDAIKQQLTSIDRISEELDQIEYKDLSEQEDQDDDALFESTAREFFLDTVLEESINTLEDLLGLTMVICQTRITQIITRVKRLEIFCNAEHNHQITLRTSKDSLMVLDPFSPIPEVTSIQVLNAYANYFKHKDEWPENWSNLSHLNQLPKQTQATISILKQTGATENLNNAFRNAANLLGNQVFYDIYVYNNRLDVWAEEIHNQIERELKAVGIIQ